MYPNLISFEYYGMSTNKGTYIIGETGPSLRLRQSAITLQIVDRNYGSEKVKTCNYMAQSYTADSDTIIAKMAKYLTK